MKKNRNYLYLFLAGVLIVAVMVVLGFKMDYLNAAVLKIAPKATNLSFCPSGSPSLIYSINTHDGDRWGATQRTSKYSTIADFARDLSTELNNNSGSSRCAYRITFVYNDEYDSKMVLTCRNNGFSVAADNSNIHCLTDSSSGKVSAGVFLYGEDSPQFVTISPAVIDLKLSQDIQESKNIEAYYVEKMTY